MRPFEMFHKGNSVIGVAGLCHYGVVHDGEGYAVYEIVWHFLFEVSV